MSFFKELLDFARLNPGTSNYTELRLAFSQSSGFKPEHRNPEFVDSLANSLQSDDWDGVLEASNYLLYENYLDIEAHQWARTAYQKKESHEFSNFHGYFSKALLESIRSSGDGISYDSAFQVLDLNEGKTFLKDLGYQVLSEIPSLNGSDNYWIITAEFPGHPAQNIHFKPISPEAPSQVSTEQQSNSTQKKASADTSPELGSEDSTSLLKMRPKDSSSLMEFVALEVRSPNTGEQSNISSKRSDTKEQAEVPKKIERLEVNISNSEASSSHKSTLSEPQISPLLVQDHLKQEMLQTIPEDNPKQNILQAVAENKSKQKMLQTIAEDESKQKMLQAQPEPESDSKQEMLQTVAEDVLIQDSIDISILPTGQYNNDVDNALLQMKIPMDPKTGKVQVSLKDLSPNVANYFQRIYQTEDKIKIKRGGYFLSLFVMGIGLLFAFITLIMLFNSSPASDGSFWSFIFVGFVTIMCLDWGGWRLFRHFSSKVGSFDYPIPFYLVKVRYDHVIGYPYLRLELEKSSLTHRLDNNEYDESILSLHFGGEEALEITFDSQTKAENFFTIVQKLQAQAWKAFESGRLHEADGVSFLQSAKRRSSKPWWFRPLTWIGISIVAAMILSPIHSWVAEGIVWSKSRSQNTAAAYESYLLRFHKGRYQAEAQTGFDAARFKDALKKKSNRAATIRQYLFDFPKGKHIEQAKKELQSSYQIAISKYESRTHSKTEASRAMLQVLRYLRKKNFNGIYLQFIPKFSFASEKDPIFQKQLHASLHYRLRSKYREPLIRMGKLQPAPIEPAFRPQDMKERESYISTAISSAFRRIIPQGILSFYPENFPPKDAKVVLQIEYEVKRKYSPFPWKRALFAEVIRSLSSKPNQQQRRRKRRRKGRNQKIRAMLKKAEALFLEKTGLQGDAKGDIYLPVVYVQTNRTRYNTERVKRTLYGINIQWSFRILLNGRSILSQKIASDTATKVKLRKGQTGLSFVYKRMAESAFDRFVTKIQSAFGVRAGVETEMQRFIWEMPYKDRLEYRRYQGIERMGRIKALWSYLDNVYHKLRSTSLLKKRLRTYKLFDRRLHLFSALKRLNRRRRKRSPSRSKSPYAPKGSSAPNGSDPDYPASIGLAPNGSNPTQENFVNPYLKKKPAPSRVQKRRPHTY